MTANNKTRLQRIQAERIQRARELIALADLSGVTIDWDGEFVTFHPADQCPPRLISEVTILTREVRALKEGRIK